jgi:hypothetical protein
MQYAAAGTGHWLSKVQIQAETLTTIAEIIWSLYLVGSEFI